MVAVTASAERAPVAASDTMAGTGAASFFHQVPKDSIQKRTIRKSIIPSPQIPNLNHKATYPLCTNVLDSE